MNQFEQDLNQAINNNIPEHQDSFWDDLEQQLGKHVPVSAPDTQAPSTGTDQSTELRLLASPLATNQPKLQTAAPQEQRAISELGNNRRRRGRTLGLFAAAACLVGLSGFGALTVFSPSPETESVTSAPLDYSGIQLYTGAKIEPPTKAEPPSSEELRRYAIDTTLFSDSQLDTGELVVPDTIADGKQMALYRIGNEITVVAIDPTPEPRTAVLFDPAQIEGDESLIDTTNAKFSPTAPTVAMPHPEGIILWNYQDGDIVFFSICPGFACSYNTSEQMGSDVWFDDRGQQLWFELVNPTDQTKTQQMLTLDGLANDLGGRDYDADENEIPGVFDGNQSQD